MIFISRSTAPTVMPKVILLLWVIHLTFIYIVDSNNVHYITPSPTTQCPGESCLTLSTLAANSSKYFDPNTTMVFLKGSHTLDSELILSNINGSLMLSTNGSGTAAIVCSGTYANLKFFHITQLQISGLEFIRCSSKVELVDQFTLENSIFYGGNNDTALYLNHTNTNITGSFFVSNTAGTYQSHVLGLALLWYSFFDVSESWLRSKIQSTSARVGGALVVTSSNVTISSSHFDSNTAKVGGAIFLQLESSINISDCTFINNSAKGCSDDGCLGGVLFIDSGCTVTAHNCTFMNNTAEYGGGAIALFQGTFSDSGYNVFNMNKASIFGGPIFAYSPSTITMDNSRYFNNTGRYGGAIYAFSCGNITVDNSSFNNNEADKHGGVVFVWQGSSITMTNSSFDNNKAVNHGGVILAYFNSSITVSYSAFNNSVAGDSDAGVLYARFNSRIIVRNSSFKNNTAGNNGGVMAAFINSNITVGNSSFINSVAGGNGGVMYANDSSSITVDSSSFDNNTAGKVGGIAIRSSSISVVDSFFEADSGGVLFGGKNSNVTVSNSSFFNNRAGDGGVMSAYSSSSISVSDSCFENNEADGSGGVLFGKKNSSITVSNSSFGNNKAARYGGVANVYSNSIIVICISFFDNNTADNDGGVIYASSSSNVSVDNSSLYNNKAGDNGGVIYASSSSNIESTVDDNNEAGNDQGTLYSSSSSIIVDNSSFHNNMASNGGVIILNDGFVEITSSRFVNNSATNSGGVLHTPSHHLVHIVRLQRSYFINNSAMSGGAIAMLFSATVTVTHCIFTHNNAIRGSAIYLLKGNNLTTSFSIYTQNSAKDDGGMIYLERLNRLSLENCQVTFNRADINGGVICLLLNSELSITGDSNIFIGNQAYSGGVAYVRESSINIHSQALLMANNTAHIGGALHVSRSRIDIYNGSILMAGNTAKDTGGAVYSLKSNLSFVSGNNTFEGNKAKIGGAIYIDEGQLVLVYGNSKLVRNIADDGGALYLSRSKLIIENDSQIIVNVNLAGHCGGGLYITTSELKIRGERSYLTRNRANSEGGGIYAANSSIIIEGAANFVSNEAENGGGVSLEKNAKLCGTSAGDGLINFVANNASLYGGAIFVDDKTNPDMCAAVSMLNTTPSIECFSKSVLINVSNNFAGVSGSTLFGGLLDRCTIDSELFVENEIYELGIMNFLNSSNINRCRLTDGISSHPVRLCFCRDGEPDCKYQPEPIQVNSGESISIELIAYDQVHHAVSAHIRCQHNLSAGGLGEGQRIQIINIKCTKLKYNVFTTNEYVRLTFSAERDPCKTISEISKQSIVINITCFCPIGFQVRIYNDKASCDCVCDPIILKLSKIIECSQTTKSIIRKKNCWISYVNHSRSNSSGYIVYPYCPFYYCYFPDKQVSINLNLPNGSDAQCDLNRTGTLCGNCKSGLSVSLGSSKCMLCPIYWPGLLITVTIVFIISGIGLVAFLLALNLTVAIGTLNAIIFYANIVVASKSALFPPGVSPASVFISWLNFDLGFDVCIFNGMDTYVKTWLQLAFPTYIIILVVVIIQLSYHFNSFGHLLGKKDPVATLATLILLSYTKLLQTIIIAFSSATLVYPDGSKKTLWLPDATVEYFTSKHAVLFFVAILILLAGVIYTLLLFLWQWLLRCPRRRVKWIRNHKLSFFMGIYLVPYTPTHRYWTGLLLLVRISVYLVSAFNPTGDPKVTLLATSFITSSLVICIATFGVRIYNNRFINAIETLTYINIITLSIFTWYTLDADTNQMAIINISVGIVFIQLIVVVVYHVYKHMNQKFFATIKRSVICMKIKTLISQEQRTRNYEDTNVLLDFVDHPFNTNDYYNFSRIQPKSPEPTQSVVERPSSQLTLAIPSPLEAKEEESELESAVQQVNKQDDISVIPVKESLSVEVCENIDDYSGIETAECNENQKVKIEHSASVKENLIPKPNFNAQINYCPTTESDTFKEANKEAVEILQSDNKDQGKQKVLLFPANSDQQVHGSWFSVHHH